MDELLHLGTQATDGEVVVTSYGVSGVELTVSAHDGTMDHVEEAGVYLTRGDVRQLRNALDAWLHANINRAPATPVEPDPFMASVRPRTYEPPF